MKAAALLLAVALAAGSPSPSKPVVTVLYFDNNSGQAELDVLRKGLADMIITDLVAWDGVSVVEREKLESVMGELKLQRTRSFDRATAARLGRFVGAQYLLTGSFALAGEELRIDARLVKTEDGKVVATSTVRGPKDGIFDLEQQLVDKVTAGIDLKVNDRGARRRVKVPDLDALLAYSQAIDLSDQGKVEEAQRKMQQLVSRSPAFLMAREKKKEILARLEELEKRRADRVTDSALQLGKLADAALADAAKFDGLEADAQLRFLSMRVVKGWFLARLLKQHLSWRRESFRVVLKGHEAPALQTMRLWLDNQRSLLDEYSRYQRLRADRWPSARLEPEVENLLRDARMGSARLPDPLFELVSFVVEGRLRDGEKHFTVAPTLGDLEPEQRKATFALLDRRIEAALAAVGQADAAGKKSAELAAIRVLEAKAEALLELGRTEEAIGAYQQILDAFPSHSNGPRYEKSILKLVGAAHDDTRNKRERWAEAMSDGCADDMDLRVSAGTALRDRMKRMGLAGLAAHAAELEEACEVTRRNRGGFAAVYRGLALTAAAHEDCEGFRAWFEEYVEVDGSVGDMRNYQKNHTPWCELGDVTRGVMWLTAQLDGSWSFELSHHLVSVRSHDGKQLALSGRDEEGPQSFHLTLKATGKDVYECREARWNRRDGTKLEGTCTVKLTELAADEGGFDEGEFTATFAREDEGPPVKLTGGSFRLRRR